MKVFDANGNELTLPIQKTWEQPIKDMAQRSPDSPPAWAFSNGQISWHEWLISQGRTEEAMAELPDGIRAASLWFEARVQAERKAMQTEREEI